jgi:hypothetical protein
VEAEPLFAPELRLSSGEDPDRVEHLHGDEFGLWIGPAPTSPPAWVELECLTGKAGGLYSGDRRTAAVNGHVLVTNGANLVYTKNRGTEGAVFADGPTVLVQKIPASVRPTGEPC